MVTKRATNRDRTAIGALREGKDCLVVMPTGCGVTPRGRYRAAVVGSGPNGLSAAIVLARAGFQVDVYEAAGEPGGGVRSGEITLPGFIHDLGSAVYALGLASPFFEELDLAAAGVEWVWSPAELAHPLDDGTAVLLHRSLRETAAGLGPDARAYSRLLEPIVRDFSKLMAETLRPLIHVPRHPFALARFGLKALQPASRVARKYFRGERARAIFAGLSAHAMLPLNAAITASFGLMFAASAHAVGWPIPRGGSGRLTEALVRILEAHGGRVHTGCEIRSLQELEPAALKMLDITPAQLLRIAGEQLPDGYRNVLQRYRYGPGIFKMDWAMREPIPWRASECRQSITVHLGGTLQDIERSEWRAWKGYPPERPFVLLVQPTLFDKSRAPEEKHVAWAYCHVPNGWNGSAAKEIEDQIERFAPGFRDCVLARTCHNTAQMEQWNANLVGGDIGGGASTLAQFVARPTLRQYETPLDGVYLCSSSTPPTAGVHGMCGANAARVALKKRHSG